MPAKKPLFLITGPSGAGKSAMAKKLVHEHGFKLVKSYTTRKPRTPDETDYNFVDPINFQRFKDMTNITIYNNNSYGVRLNDLMTMDLYIVDPAGIEFMRKHHSNIFDIYVIGIMAHPEDLTARMYNRGDSWATIRSRMENDEKAFAVPNCWYDIIINNHDLDETVATALYFIKRMIARNADETKRLADIAKRDFDFLFEKFNKHGTTWGHIERLENGSYCGMIDDDIIMMTDNPDYPNVPENIFLAYRQRPFIIQPYYVDTRLVNITVKLVDSPDPLFMVDTPYKKAGDNNGSV